MYALRLLVATGAVMATTLLSGCGPKAHIPSRPTIASALPDDDPVAHMVRALAPVLYLQRDEWFRLERVVAAVHPKRPIIGYYLLWRDDVHGAWLPFTNATDVWTYWHGKVLHADWRDRGTVTIDVQWGKHGSLPRGITNEDAMWPRTM